VHGAIVWPEGVAVVKTGMEIGKPRAYKYEEPYEEKEVVTPLSHGTVITEIALMLRPVQAR